MALGESCASSGISGDELKVPVVSASSPKKRKRTLQMRPENASTPYSCAKRSRLQRPDGVQREAPVQKVTFSTSIMRITRGVQTVPPPEKIDRQTQVSVVPRKQSTVAVQTEGGTGCDGVIAIACQTSIDDLVTHEEACIGTSQPYPPEKPPQTDAACQTTATVAPVAEEEPTPDQAITLMMLATSGTSEKCHQTTMTTATGNDELTDTRHREILRRIAQSYGLDLSSGAERSQPENHKQNKKKKKKNKDRQQHQEIDEAAVANRERLLTETCDTVMAKVDEKLSTVIAGHLEMYRRRMVQHRQRYLSWIEEQKARGLLAVRRKLIDKRQNGIQSVATVPSEEKAVQCDPPAAALMSQRVDVATQWTRQPRTRSKVVQPKPKVDSSKPIKPPPTVSTDTKRPAADQDLPKPQPTRRQTLRQTKLPVYAESRPASGDQRGRKGKHSSESADQHQPPVLAATATGDTSANRKPRGQSTKRTPPSPAPAPEPEHVEETPSEASDEECRNDRKHYPYRAPAPIYLSQCSKSTAASFPTPSKLRDHHHHHQRHAHQHCHPVGCGSDESSPDFSMLLSPLERMYVGRGTRGCSGHCTNSIGLPSGYLPPMGSESIPPTPPRPKPKMMYVNRSQPRVLIRTKSSSNHIRTREKPAPEVNVISSQELYTQIGRAVENAFRAKAMPTLATMYGEPFIETFNAIDEEVEEEEDTEENPKTRPRPRPGNQFVCSSGKDTAAGGVAGVPPRAPFYPERSPSLSPIIYEDDSDEDGL